MSVTVGPVRTLTRRKPRRFRALIYGATKLGKTTFGAACHAADRQSLVVPTCRGYEALAGVPMLIDSREMPFDLGGLEKALALVDQRQYDTLVVDDIQGLLSMLQEEVATRYGKANFDEVEAMRAWPALRQRLFAWLTWLAKAAPNLLLISREKAERTISREVVRLQPDLPPSLWNGLAGDLDLIGHVALGVPTPQDKTPGSVLSFRPRPGIEAGQRWTTFASDMPLDGHTFWNLWQEFQESKET